MEQKKRTIESAEAMTKYAGEVIAEMAGEILRPAILSRHLPINMKLSMSSYYLRPIKTIGRVYFIGFIPKSERICPENQEKLDIKKTRRLMTS